MVGIALEWEATCDAARRPTSQRLSQSDYLISYTITSSKAWSLAQTQNPTFTTRPRIISDQPAMNHHTFQIEAQSNLLHRFTSLPLELRHHIIELTFTPLKRSEAPLVYIVDPMVNEDFRNQRDESRRQIQHFRDLGAQVTGDGYIETITKIWRAEWESSMSSMISDDENEWKRIIDGSHIFAMTTPGHHLPIKDIHGYAEREAEMYGGNSEPKWIPWMLMRCVIWNLRHTRLESIRQLGNMVGKEVFDQASARRDRIEDFYAAMNYREPYSRASLQSLQKAWSWEEKSWA